MDIGETLADTATREVFEETGITLDKQKISLLAVYESVYPVVLGAGPPTDHHIHSFTFTNRKNVDTFRNIVVYLKALVDVPETEMILQVSEVDAAAWVDKKIVESALSMDKTQGSSSPTLTFPAFELCLSGQGKGEKGERGEDEKEQEKDNKVVVVGLREVEYDVQRLRTDRGADGSVARERLSTGSRFALREWMARL